MKDTPAMKFTDKYISRLAPRAVAFDMREGDGFVLRVQPTGKKSFYYVYVVEGKIKRLHLGVYPFVTLADAREKHRAALTVRHHGGDPRGAVQPVATVTVKTICEEYIKLSAKPHKRRWRFLGRGRQGR